MPNFCAASICKPLQSDSYQSDNKLAGNLGIADTVGRGLLPYKTSDDVFDDKRMQQGPAGGSVPRCL